LISSAMKSLHMRNDEFGMKEQYILQLRIPHSPFPN
jgi:hypothetical protein